MVSGSNPTVEMRVDVSSMDWVDSGMVSGSGSCTSDSVKSGVRVDGSSGKCVGSMKSGVVVSISGVRVDGSSGKCVGSMKSGVELAISVVVESGGGGEDDPEI